MKKMRKTLLLAPLLATFRLFAQCPCPEAPPPPPDWTGSFGAGLALTSGNSDTKTFNLSFNAVYDPKSNAVLKIDGFYLRGEKDGDATVDRNAAGLRLEYKVRPQIFVFAEVRYLRDQFKGINYLITPMIGAGYQVIKTDPMLLQFDAGVGGAFQKNYGESVNSAAAVQLGDTFNWKLSKTATLSQNLRWLFKLNDTSDFVLHFDVGLSAELVKNLELKIAFLDDFNNKVPVGADIKKNDTALVASVLYKF
jgi:putative salt-induced outer membrane protein YdiY